MNNHTLYEGNNHNPIDSTNKMGGNFPKKFEMADTRLQVGVDINFMLPEYTIHQYTNM